MMVWALLAIFIVLIRISLHLRDIAECLRRRL
jgi:hypothetical protein